MQHKTFRLHRRAFVAARAKSPRGPEIVQLLEVRLPILAQDTAEYRPYEMVCSHPTIEGADESFDHLFAYVVRR